MALDNLKPNISWQSVTICISQILNNFIKNRLTEKSKDLRLALVKGQASSPYSRIGRHLDVITSIIGVEKTDMQTQHGMFNLR